MPGNRLEAFMQLKVIVLVAVGLWFAVVVMVVSLCLTARRSDEAMDTALAEANARTPDAEVARPPFERALRTLSLEHAAILLDVRPETLLAWEARYGFPTSSSTEGRYSRSEMLALRDSLECGLSIASAVIRAREQTRRRRTAIAAQAVEHRDGGLAS